MANPTIVIATGISSIGMLLLFLFATPLQALPAQTSVRQRLSMSADASSFHLASSTQTLMPALVSAAEETSNLNALSVITISVQAEPASRQDFRFHGDLGDFRLDQASPDDEDDITQSVTFTVTPGVYTVTAELPLTWHLSQIDCTPAAQAQVTLLTGQATLTLYEGDQLHCNFVNERGVIIRTRSYRDLNGSRSLSLGERYLSGWEMTVYKDQNLVMGTQTTNAYGKANFNYLPAGEYAVCQAGQTSWENSQPGLANTTYGGFCYLLTLHSGEVATLWFGNQQPGDTLPTTQPTTTRVTATVQGADVASDESGYEDWEFIDVDMTQDDRAPAVFLPITHAP